MEKLNRFFYGMRDSYETISVPFTPLGRHATEEVRNKRILKENLSIETEEQYCRKELQIIFS
jgi:hypothetical protein